MTSAIFNTPAGELEQQAKSVMRNQTKFLIMPVWLDETLQAHRVTESVLSDESKVNSILTEDDIKFYNQQVNKLSGITHGIPIQKDIELTRLYSNKKLYGMGEPIESTESYEENSIGKKEILSPFIAGAQSLSVEKLWNIVATFSVNKLADHNLIVIRLVSVPYEDVLPLQLKQDELLAEFLIGEYGLREVAGTQLFKKLLEFKSCY